jgi:23S rRNA (adenine2030-N6)-methyltransferase
MNYRHAFHAGNHCDVLKHAALTLVLARLAGKDKPFMVLDTHAGRGAYDLESPEAARSGEHFGGIMRVAGDPDASAALAPYLDAVRRHNPFGGSRWYPGSPAIIRDALRAGDSAKFCELHPEERHALETAMQGDRQVAIFDRDGYQAVRAFLPPHERRGLVLIDPPFEKPGEYRRLAEAVGDGVRRWACGIFMIWRPVKDEAGFRGFTQQIDALGLAKTLVAELRVAPLQDDRLSGSGLFIVNPPFGLANSLTEILPYLATRLAASPGGGWHVRETENRGVICDAGGSA